MTRLLDKICTGFGTYRNALSMVQDQYDPDIIYATQIRKLKKLTRYCYSSIKYYRELFDQVGINPEQVNSIKDLLRIPITTKKELRDRFWDFLPSELPACRVSRTSGSTGVPVCLLSGHRGHIV